MSSAAQSGTPKWPGDHAEKHRQAALLGWARKRGFTRDTVKRGRRKETQAPQAPLSRGMELARQAKASAQRARPAADPGYSPHTLPVARLTLTHELSMEPDAAKRTKIRRELRKLGVPSDQIPKEPRKPRAVEKMSTFQLNQEMGAASGERRAAILVELARRRGERHEAARKPRRARQARDRSAAVSQPKAARKRGGGAS